MRAELRKGADVVEVALDAGDNLAAVQPRIIVAIGARGCESAVQRSSRTPLLCVLLPRSAFERAAAGAAGQGRVIGAVLLDQPLPRQLAFIRLALPEARELGALLGQESAPIESALSRAAREQGLRVSTARVAGPGELYPALQTMLASSDVLLALPDSGVFNSSTAQNVLRTAFHARVPLVAFSPAYVKAGALAAVYTTPAQIGRQAGRTLNDFLDGRPLPASQGPREFEISINGQVARALGVRLDNEMDLSAQLRKLELSR
jgi:putative ABC transport system substrate-binding protein